MKMVLFLGLVTVSGALWAAESKKLDQVWQTAGLRTPESVLFYPNGKDPFLFVSEIEGEPAGVDGKGGIAKLDLEGKIIEADWVRGLNAPKGMAVYEDFLYVSDITELVVIRIATGELVRTIPVEGAEFLNDVAVNSRGEVFVSDTRTNKVHKLVDDQIETYLAEVPGANGLATLGGNLVIGANDKLWLVYQDQQLIKIAEGFAAPADGVEMAGPGEFIVSCWAGLIYYVYSDGKKELLIDSRNKEVNTADIGYDYDSRVVYVPNFFKNTVTAYQLK